MGEEEGRVPGDVSESTGPSLGIGVNVSYFLPSCSSLLDYSYTGSESGNWDLSCHLKNRPVLAAVYSIKKLRLFTQSDRR